RTPAVSRRNSTAGLRKASTPCRSSSRAGFISTRRPCASFQPPLTGPEPGARRSSSRLERGWRGGSPDRSAAWLHGARPHSREIVMAKSDSTGKRKLKAHNVSHSNIKTNRWQNVNVQTRRVWVPELKRFVTLNLTTRDLRTIDKIGITAYAK